MHFSEGIADRHWSLRVAGSTGMRHVVYNLIYQSPGHQKT